jgi:hypothetical protein
VSEISAKALITIAGSPGLNRNPIGERVRFGIESAKRRGTAA